MTLRYVARWTVVAHASLLLAGGAGTRVTAQTPSPLGRGWVQVPAPSEGSPERQCANRTDWTAQVRLLADGRVEAAKNGDYGRAVPPAAPPLPFPVVSDIKAGGPLLTKAIPGGYLVGFNHGEFGGSVWWYDATGTSKRRLGDAHPVGFVDVVLPGRTILTGVVEGLAHMGEDAGSVSIVERDAAGALSLKPLARFDSAPKAVGRSGPAGTLVATGLAVVRVAPDGTIRRVASIDTRDLYPQSIVEAANGSIFLGMRRYVVEVAPGTLSTRISWYTDAACPVFRPGRQTSCVCG